MITLCTLEQTYEARDRPSFLVPKEKTVDIVVVNASYLNLDPTIIGLHYAVLYPFSSFRGSERDRSRLLMYEDLIM